MSFYKNTHSSIVHILPEDFYIDDFEYAINGKHPYVIEHKDKIFKLDEGEVFGDEFKRDHPIYIKTVEDYPYCSDCDKCIFGNQRGVSCQLFLKKQEIEKQLADKYFKHKTDHTEYLNQKLKSACDCIDCHFEEVQL